ncbi:uncharacterized protein LOC134304832 [Trichomycterus rosablanca]|uniref:uncharacterized protein LOC134304832 n=1 Tax=Trichomycterus rosablanca TaxID=2290929 RepID=UPI002F360915
MDLETREMHDGRKGYQKEKRSNTQKQRYEYKKEATIIVDVSNLQEVTATEIIKAINEEIGFGKLLAVRYRQNKEFEATLQTEEDCLKLLDGLMIKGRLCDIRRLCCSEMTVSFLNLPAYLEDKIILDKLLAWGVTPSLPIRRRFYPGTTIADGTRFLKVKFPKEITSLPYSTKIETAEGLQYFRVIHDGQIRLCRLCAGTGHLIKDCPNLVCRECMEQGHFAKYCKAIKCPDCNHALISCTCTDEEEIEKEKEQENGEGKEHNIQHRKTEEESNNERLTTQEEEEKLHNQEDNKGKDEYTSAQKIQEMDTEQQTDPMTDNCAEREVEEERMDMDNTNETENKDTEKERSKKQQNKGAEGTKRKVKFQPNLAGALEKQRKRRETSKDKWLERTGMFDILTEELLE